MASSDSVPAFVAQDHNHDHCLSDALVRARNICMQRGARLTDLRQQVLELVWAGHKPLGAYEILDALRMARGKAAPPTVYRALEFLLHHGLIHRIESQNAYVGCTEPELPHGGQFLICLACGATVELNDPRIDAAIAEQAKSAGFSIESRTVEVDGVCPHCTDSSAA